MGYRQASPAPGLPPLRKTQSEIEKKDRIQKVVTEESVRKTSAKPGYAKDRNADGNSSMLVHNVSKQLRRRFHAKCLEKNSTMTAEIVRLMKEFIGEQAIP